jgi:hypothetical protein
MRDPPAHRVGVRQPAEEGGHFPIGLRPDDEVPVVGQDAVRQDADRVPPVRLEQDAMERLEVGVLAEQAHPAHRAVQHVVDLPAGRVSCASWHAPEIITARQSRQY